MDEFERLATNEELDREHAGALGAHFEEVEEWGEFDENGGRLSRADFEDARARA